MAKSIKINYPVNKKIEIIVNISEYTKAMAFKSWLEYNAGFHTYYPNPITCVYDFNILCDDFIDCAKIETYLQTNK